MLLLHQITIIASQLLTVLSSCNFVSRRKCPILETFLEVAKKFLSLELRTLVGRKDSESACWADMSQRSQSKSWSGSSSKEDLQDHVPWSPSWSWGSLNMIFMTMFNDHHDDHYDIYLHNSSNNLALKATLYLLSLGTEIEVSSQLSLILSLLVSMGK